MQSALFLDARQQIEATLRAFLAEQRRQLSPLNPLTTDIFDRLETFSTRGKMIRGSLALVMTELLAGKPVLAAAKVGAAIELLESAFLIHDDIMDQDRIRRGQPALFVQFEEDGQQHGFANASHFGQSVAICVGDIALFLVQNLLAHTELSVQSLRQLQLLFSQESTKTCFGQVLDITTAAHQNLPSLDDIFSIYVYKTARYTLCLPLLSAGALATQSPEVMKQLDHLGEIAGVLFQIKDDELGIFGEESQTGKPVGADLREGKKTLYAYYLLSQVSDSEQSYFRSLIGNPKLTTEEVKMIQEKMKAVNVVQMVQQHLDKLESEAQAVITELPFATEVKVFLQTFIQFTLLRRK